MKLLVLIVFLAIAFLVFLAVKSYIEYRQVRRWKIETKEVVGNKTQVFLVKGSQNVPVGEPFPAYDESRLAEHCLDAERIRKDLEKNL